MIVRPGISFWIASDPHALTSTMSAFKQGVFEDAVCFDRSGSCWAVAEATLSHQHSLSDRLLPWRVVRVSVVYGQERRSGLHELKARLCQVVDSRNEFVDTLETDADALQREIEATDSFETLLEVLETAYRESPADD